MAGKKFRQNMPLGTYYIVARGKYHSKASVGSDPLDVQLQKWTTMEHKVNSLHRVRMVDRCSDSTRGGRLAGCFEICTCTVLPCYCYCLLRGARELARVMRPLPSFGKRPPAAVSETLIRLSGPEGVQGWQQWSPPLRRSQYSPHPWPHSSDSCKRMHVLCIANCQLLC